MSAWAFFSSRPTVRPRRPHTGIGHRASWGVWSWEGASRAIRTPAMVPMLRALAGALVAQPGDGHRALARAASLARPQTCLRACSRRPSVF